MTAQVLEFRRPGGAPLTRTPLPPRPTLTVPAVAWWTCPYWCTGGSNCYGGDTLDFGRGTSTVTSRMHHGVILAEQVRDVDGGDADVRVEIFCVEDPDEGFTEQPAVTIQADVNTTDLDAAQRIADAIQAAIHHARQPLPALSPRSLPHGGGLASMSGRGTPRSPARTTPLESA